MAKQTKASTANLGFEDKLWATADKLRGNMDAAEYKHVVLGLIFPCTWLRAPGGLQTELPTGLPSLGEY